jgi:hypothetical protein
MKGESPDPRIPCGPFWLSPEKETMSTARAGKTGAVTALLLCSSLILLPSVQAAGVLLGNGSYHNHLLILFATGQTVQYELRHDGTVRTGAQLLSAVIQSTAGTSVTTPAQDSNGNPIRFSSALTSWNGQGLFAHIYDYGWGLFVNGFASGSLSAAADGSWSSYFTYQIAGADAAFTSAPVGASNRTLRDGDHDAYVLTSTHASPGLAAWMLTHGITDLTADPDADGMSNLFEYALRRHPHQPDSAPAVTADRTQLSDNAYLTLTYRRPHDVWATIPDGADAGYDGVGYTVETSADLTTWQSGTNHVTQIVSPDPSGPMATVEARVPADSPRRFLRLKVFLP